MIGILTYMLLMFMTLPAWSEDQHENQKINPSSEIIEKNTVINGGAAAAPLIDAEKSYSSAEKTEKIDSNRYYSQDALFSIEFPDSWEQVVDQDASSLGAISPRSGAEDTFRENILVGSFPLTDDLTLFEYFSGNLEYLKQHIPGMKVLSSRSIILDGEEAVKVVYSTPIEGVSYKTMQIFVIKGGRGYIITTMGEVEDFEEYEMIFDKMIDSFRFQ